jgi:phosphoribosylanthranilate isomerase
LVKVKICGITNWADAQRAVKAGVDALGFNFYAPSPRYIAPAEARKIVRRLPRRVRAVGVFVNAPVDVTLKIARAADLDILQLHGEETPETVKALAQFFPVVKAFRVSGGFRPAQLARYRAAMAFLLDGFDAEWRGGTGKTFDWRLAREAKRYGPVILAGGITPANVAQAIAAVQPFAIDVCGGVEARPGKKDAVRLRALMRRVEAARRKLP